METNERPSHQQMVTNLFKKMEGAGAEMLHAAIGIAGESGELRTATKRKEIIEECGDLEFYIEAAWQKIPNRAQLEMQKISFIGLATAENITLGTVVDNISIIGSELLDFAKKVWVYQGAKGDRDESIAATLRLLRLNLDKLYEMTGITREDVLTGNQDKLLGSKTEVGRYAAGTYSDAAALARADKGGEGTGRKFMSDTPVDSK